MGNRQVARLLPARDNAHEIPIRAGSKIPTGFNKYLVGSFVVMNSPMGRDVLLMVGKCGSPLFLRGGSTVRCLGEALFPSYSRKVIECLRLPRRCGQQVHWYKPAAWCHTTAQCYRSSVLLSDCVHKTSSR